MRLDPVSAPFKLVLLTVLDLFFMPAPRLLGPAMEKLMKPVEATWACAEGVP